MTSVGAFVDVFLGAVDSVAFVAGVADALETGVGIYAFCVVVTVVGSFVAFVNSYRCVHCIRALISFFVLVSIVVVLVLV